MKRIVSILLLAILCGCASEWRTAEPVTPSTYAAPSHRSASSIGRLSRLAVLPVVVHLETDDATLSAAALDERRQTIRRELQVAIKEFLITRKGYEVRLSERQVTPSDAKAIQEIGQQLGVDGIVVTERWVAKPWSTAKGVLNVFALNIPLFNALSAVNLRISIFDTASGRLAWQKELKGEDSSDRTELEAALSDMDNAVPPQLRR